MRDNRYYYYYKVETSLYYPFKEVNVYVVTDLGEETIAYSCPYSAEEEEFVKSHFKAARATKEWARCYDGIVRTIWTDETYKGETETK